MRAEQARKKEEARMDGGLGAEARVGRVMRDVVVV